MEMQPPDVPVPEEPTEGLNVEMVHELVGSQEDFDRLFGRGTRTRLGEHLHKMEICLSNHMVAADKTETSPSKEYAQGIVKGYSDAFDSLKQFERGSDATPVSEAVSRLIAALKADLDFAWTYHCNVAMAFQDEGGNYDVANRAAARFMKLFADVDTTKHPAYFE